ncbi:MAG: hypothetical protein IJ188_10525 [Clostridia bacterium]|nr:hypothetical protein [Clostridia bacterium]
MINTENLALLLDSYKKAFPSIWNGEIYKWIAIKCYQDNWDLNAEDFSEMFRKATDKTLNLLASGYAYPRAMIIEMAKAAPEEVREMFRRLYDESLDLSLRVEEFQAKSEEIRQKYNDGTWKNHFQSTNSISTYLWLRYPDKYYVYKYGLYADAARELDSDNKPKANG